MFTKNIAETKVDNCMVAGPGEFAPATRDGGENEDIFKLIGAQPKTEPLPATDLQTSLLRQNR
jgi:hypothetical protein